MTQYNIYNDIAERSGGDVYVGVVGPVRTGKSTFIKKFMDLLVIPNIPNTYKRERAKDELPQSSGGRTIMTTEPKFIPNEAVNITLADNASFNVRMIDCVGYIVDSALGHIEEDTPRMVKTPWSEEEIPFVQAAEIGTKKVICEHSTIGIVVTTDGSITDIPREDYIEAESRAISELKEINKPFIVLLNSVDPGSRDAIRAKEEIESRHEVPVVSVNCAKLTQEDIQSIIKAVLFRFPLKEISIDIPDWLELLESDHWLKKSVYDSVLSSIKSVFRISDYTNVLSSLENCENIEKATVSEINLGEGTVHFDVTTADNLFYEILGEKSGFRIDGKDTLLSLMSELSHIKKEYEKIEYALKQVYDTGYGIVAPTIDELELEEPEIVKQGGRFGVKLKASAPSVHMILANIETEVSPIVGTEKQSEELVQDLLKQFEENPKEIWHSNIFGKSLHELVNDGLHNKLYKMSDDARYKLQETLQRIINEGSGGLICIIL